MKSMTIDLNESIVLNEIEYKSLTLYPFKAKHLKSLPESFFNMDAEEAKELNAKAAMNFAVDMMPLIAALANVSEDVIGELSFEDLMKVTGELAPFLEGCLKTGKS